MPGPAVVEDPATDIGMPGPAVVEDPATDIGMAERLVVAEPDLVDKSAGTAADGLPLVVEDKLVVPVEAAAGRPAEVRIAVAVRADAALDTEWPADSGSRMVVAVFGTVDPVGATAVVARLGSASESAGRNSFLMSTSSSRRSAGTDLRRRLPLRTHCPRYFHKDCMTKRTGCTMEHTVRNTKRHTGGSANQVPTACIASGL